MQLKCTGEDYPNSPSLKTEKSFTHHHYSTFCHAKQPNIHNMCAHLLLRFVYLHLFVGMLVFSRNFGQAARPQTRKRTNKTNDLSQFIRNKMREKTYKRMHIKYLHIFEMHIVTRRPMTMTMANDKRWPIPEKRMKCQPNKFDNS